MNNKTACLGNHMSTLPAGANCLPLLWTYYLIYKDNGWKKAQCVCNGAPSKKGSVTLGHTYAGSLKHSGNRTFWVVSALKNMVVYGVDASNAFAEAPAPKAPLFVNLDQPFREWWASKNRTPIPKGYVLPVTRALQGHPESSCLWSILIDKILHDKPLNFKPRTMPIPWKAKKFFSSDRLTTSVLQPKQNLHQRK